LRGAFQRKELRPAPAGLFRDFTTPQRRVIRGNKASGETVFMSDSPRRPADRLAMPFVFFGVHRMRAKLPIDDPEYFSSRDEESRIMAEADDRSREQADDAWRGGNIRGARKAS